MMEEKEIRAGGSQQWKDSEKYHLHYRPTPALSPSPPLFITKMPATCFTNNIPSTSGKQPALTIATTTATYNCLAYQ
jgi:hypothetical protein